MAAVQGLAAPARVKVGVCGSPDNFEKAVAAGFEYYEPSAAVVSGLGEAQYAAFRDRVLSSKIRCECFNGLIRTDKVVGPEVDLARVSEYLERTLSRCKELGATIAVWGSASSRNVPDGFSRDQAWSQIKIFLGQAGEIARRKGIVIAIEPLRKQESNIINTGAEALRLVNEVHHPQVQMIIDYYHMRVENEDPEILKTAREHIVHLHFANPNGRKWPKSEAEDPVYGRFFELVKSTGFAGGLSIEGSGTFEADAEASLAFFRKELS